MSMKNIRIGETLVDFGYITSQQLEKALVLQKSDKKKRLGAILIENGFITEPQLLEALAKRLDLKIVDLSQISADIDAVRQIPQQLAEKYGMLAIEMAPGTLTVAMNDPLDFYAIEDISQLTGRTLNIVLTPEESLRRLIKYYYSEVHARLASDAANKAVREKTEELSVNIEEGDAPIIRLLDSFIEHAYSRGASDIHIEPFEQNTVVRMRIDGMLVKFVTLQKQVHQPLIARIKIMSNLDIAEKRVPQDGHFRSRIGAKMVNLRVSLIPTVYGEKAVLRILAGSSRIDHADHFGMSDGCYAKFCEMLEAPNGIIYITGPTGSGKSTTLYMVLQTLADKLLNISTIEDPVEKQVARINQMQVNNLSGLTFESGLRALLRQDPDIIMVGETRDTETANISVRAAITGHLVFSTLHTNSAAGSIVRLTDMGVQPYLIANSLVGIVAQRLVRKVCPECSKLEEATPDELLTLGIDGPVKVMHAYGCERCNHTGYRGRTAVHEMLMIDRAIREMISNSAEISKIEEYARKTQGMRTLGESAKELVLAGVTTVDEMKKIAYYN